MARDQDDERDEDDERHPRSPLDEILGRLFGGGGPPIDLRAEREAFGKARLTALRAGKAMVSPQHTTKGVFTSHLRDKVFGPLMADPLVSDEDVGRLLAALEVPTGELRESAHGGPPRPAVWSDTLHDLWFDNLVEHVAFHLWVRLQGTAAEKEDMLDEMVAVLEKYGGAIMATFAYFNRPPDEAGNAPIVSAGLCALRSIKGAVAAKAKELKVGPYGRR